MLDYRIIREGPKANDRLAALLQIKIDAVDDTPLPEDELCKAPGDSAPKSVTSRFVLRGLGWDDYALFVCFDTFHDLAAYWIALEGWFATRKRTIRYRTIGILHRIGLEPPEPTHDWRSVLKGRLKKGGPDMLIGYVVKLRTGRWSAIGPEHSRPAARTYEDKLREARSKLDEVGSSVRNGTKTNALALELRACSGLDDLELRCTLSGVPDEPLDKNECLASVSLYLEVARAVGEIFEVFDAQTTVLLPDGF